LLLAVTLWNGVSAREERRRINTELLDALLAAGIEVECELDYTPAPAPLKKKRDAASEGRIAAAIIGESRCAENPPGGAVVLYYNDIGSLYFNARGGFVAEFDDGVPLGGGAEKVAARYMEKMGVPVFEINTFSEGNMTTVVITTACADLPVFNARVSFETENGVLYRVWGLAAVLASSSAEEEGVELPTALLTLAGEVRRGAVQLSRIISVTPGWVLEPDAFGGGRLVPGWRVEADTGVWFMNSATAQCNPAEW
jgi:hypothetical protein